MPNLTVVNPEKYSSGLKWLGTEFEVNISPKVVNRIANAIHPGLTYTSQTTNPALNPENFLSGKNSSEAEKSGLTNSNCTSTSSPSKVSPPVQCISNWQMQVRYRDPAF